MRYLTALVAVTCLATVSMAQVTFTAMDDFQSYGDPVSPWDVSGIDDWSFTAHPNPGYGDMLSLVDVGGGDIEAQTFEGSDTDPGLTWHKPAGASDELITWSHEFTPIETGSFNRMRHFVRVTGPDDVNDWAIAVVDVRDGQAPYTKLHGKDYWADNTTIPGIDGVFTSVDELLNRTMTLEMEVDDVANTLRARIDTGSGFNDWSSTVDLSAGNSGHDFSNANLRFRETGTINIDNLSVVAQVVPPQTDFAWDVDSGGDWSDVSNWNPIRKGVGGNDHNVTFAGAISAPRTVFTDAAVTVKSITFGDTDGGAAQQSYAIAGNSQAGSVNLESDTSLSTISVLEGSHEFQAVVNLGNAADIDTASGTSLTFTNSLNLAGNTLNKTGDGTIAINNILATGGGTLNCNEGTCSGSGQISGDVNNSGGTISPGNSPGVMEVSGDFNQGENGTLSIELAGTTVGGQYDLLSVGGTADLQGTLSLVLLDGFQPSVGDSFDILEFGSLSGGFERIDLPALAGGLSWELGQLYESGTVTVMPEPTTMGLLVWAFACLAWSRMSPRPGTSPRLRPTM